MTKLNKNFQKFLSVFLLFFCGGFIFAAKNASYYFNEGKNLQLAEDWYGAIECFSESTRLNPSYGEAYFKLAECFYAVDEYELSLQNLDLASKYLRNRADLENLRGFSYIGLGDLVEAEKIFSAILQSYPNDIVAIYSLSCSFISFNSLVALFVATTSTPVALGSSVPL